MGRERKTSIPEGGRGKETCVQRAFSDLNGPKKKNPCCGGGTGEDRRGISLVGRPAPRLTAKRRRRHPWRRRGLFPYKYSEGGIPEARKRKKPTKARVKEPLSTCET